MRLLEAWRVAQLALRANRMRSALTMFGVIMGVASVVLLMAIGAGTKQEVQRQVEGLGSNLLMIVPGRLQLGTMPPPNAMNMSDVEAVSRAVGDPDLISPLLTSSDTVRLGGKAWYTRLYGDQASAAAIFNRSFTEGGYLSRADVDGGRRVAVIGTTVSRHLFGDRSPIGAQVTIAGARFRVVGVLSPTGHSLGVDRDDEIHIPITTAHRLLDTQRVDSIVVRAPDAGVVAELGATTIATLQARHPDLRYSVVSQEQILGVLGNILGILTGTLAAVAGISLLVGGVGVSNIMLVSVRERTREIGLRKAVGAKPRDIATQFLLEAILLTTLGGVVGLGLGVGLSWLISAVSPMPTAVSVSSGVLAFGVSAVVGIIFGVVPAQRAGRLDPVLALRTE